MKPSGSKEMNKILRYTMIQNIRYKLHFLKHIWLLLSNCKCQNFGPGKVEICLPAYGHLTSTIPSSQLIASEKSPRYGLSTGTNNLHFWKIDVKLFLELLRGLLECIGDPMTRDCRVYWKCAQGMKWGSRALTEKTQERHEKTRIFPTDRSF